MPINGIDVSEYQKDINWKDVLDAGMEFAMVRATIGPKRVDQNFSKNATEALQNGVNVGAYHYCHARNVEESRQEALHFLDVVSGYNMTYPLAFDIEDSSLEDLSKEVLTDISVVFLNTLVEANYFPMIYANLYWFTHVLDDGRLKKYDHWVAQYDGNNDYLGITGMWQYSNTGRVNGIEGDVDLNYSYKDYASIILNGGYNNLKRFRESRFYRAGDKVTLHNSPIYGSYDDLKPFKRISGNFYLYDGISFVNQLGETRYRITKNKDNVGNGMKYVIGSVKDSDFKN